VKRDSGRGEGGRIRKVIRAEGTREEVMRRGERGEETETREPMSDEKERKRQMSK